MGTSQGMQQRALEDKKSFKKWLVRSCKVSALYLTYLVHGWVTERLKCCFTPKLARDTLSNSQAACLERQVWGKGRLEPQIREYRNQENYCLSGKGAIWPICQSFFLWATKKIMGDTRGMVSKFYSHWEKNCIGSSILKVGGKSQEMGRK